MDIIIFWIVVAIVVLGPVVWRHRYVVAPGTALVVARGRRMRALEPGTRWLVPLVDRVVQAIDLGEHDVEFGAHPIISKDSRHVSVMMGLRYRIADPVLAAESVQLVTRLELALVHRARDLLGSVASSDMSAHLASPFRIQALVDADARKLGAAVTDVRMALEDAAGPGGVVSAESTVASRDFEVVATDPRRPFRSFGVLRIVPQAMFLVVERFGSRRELAPGIHLLAPFVDRVVAAFNMREHGFALEAVDTRLDDGSVLRFDAQVSYSVTDAVLASRVVPTGPAAAIEAAVPAALADAFGSRPAERVRKDRQTADSIMRVTLDELADPLGMRINQVTTLRWRT